MKKLILLIAVLLTCQVALATGGVGCGKGKGQGGHDGRGGAWPKTTRSR